MLQTIEKEMNASQFAAYARAQVAKAKTETGDARMQRLGLLKHATEVAKQSFASNDTASVPTVVEAKADETTIDPQTALGGKGDQKAQPGSEKPDGSGGFASNPEDLGEDMTKRLDAALAKADSLTKGTKVDKSDKSGDTETLPREMLFKDLDEGHNWPEDIADTRDPPEDWGRDPWHKKPN